MNFIHPFGVGDEDVLGAIHQLIPTPIFDGGVLPVDHGAHCTINDQDALPHDLQEFLVSGGHGEVFVWGLHSSFTRNKAGIEKIRPKKEIAKTQPIW